MLMLPVFLILPSLLFSLTSSHFVCPGICCCSAETIRCTEATERSLPGDQKDVFKRLTLTHLSLSSVASHSFDGLSGVLRIEIAQSDTLKTIEAMAFNNLPNLSEISIQNTKNLVHISQRAFNNLPRLRYLSVSNTGITVIPDVSSIYSLESVFILDICDNLHLESIPANAFAGLSNEHTTMILHRNGFKEIEDYAFNGTRIHKLILKNNKHLRTIHKDAFKGAVGPGVLDVSLTALEALPSRGLQSLRLLVARGTYSLKSLPPLGALESLQEAQLTYPSHCCALFDWNARRDSAFFDIGGNGSYCEDGFSSDIPGLAADSTAVPPLKDPAMSEEYREALDPVDFYYPDFDFCRSPRMLRCTPEADAFNPCEDIAGFQFLRVAIWFINVLAITGNLMVLLVLVASRGKLTVPRFLMCHLAFADLCIGIYLLMIAIVDGRTRGSYSQHAIAWQTGPGCAAAGFLSVFGSELSVYTLTAITLERWHTIDHALQPERRLGLSRALLTMAGGWFLCLGVALLPLVGVSSYRKVSVCLPMDIETPLAQAFVILLLFLNVAAFLIVCACYARIYQAVWNPEFAGRNADAKIAKRMAVLIFTDFLCMAPISFFAISAAFKVPLITVTNSKILLVLFYPINSCANPFLYAICTKAFRRDVFALASTLPCCESKASVYRTKAYCLDNSADKPSSVAAAKKSSHIALRMAAFSSSIPAE
ncbi:lutropin-choriogonadotropic hormone receptor [Scleropages formosus]|uniref:Lutropin-choriogonadotropic hormone receptor n=1 Tax=Scleropages formosus TaxID=113540 RepID=A0A8C9R4I6_SCLFO|nr:lutropin-choriogonadotropic hormone receptor-like [Scleropages formosus]